MPSSRAGALVPQVAHRRRPGGHRDHQLRRAVLRVRVCSRGPMSAELRLSSAQLSGTLSLAVLFTGLSARPARAREPPSEVPRICDSSSANLRQESRIREKFAISEVQRHDLTVMAASSSTTGMRTRFAQSLVEETLSDTPITVIQGGR